MIAKWVLKIWIIINKRRFLIFRTTAHTKVSSHEEEDIKVRLQLNEKKSKESQTRLMGWYWKRKPTWRKDLITYNSHPWIMFSFNWLAIIWIGALSEIGRPKSRAWKNFGRRRARGVGWGLKIGQFSWMSYVYYP